MTQKLKKAFDEVEGVQKLVSSGLTDKVVRNRPTAYRRLDLLLSHTTAQELLDQDREDR
jgi:hypothetical protein